MTASSACSWVGSAEEWWNCWNDRPARRFKRPGRALTKPVPPSSIEAFLECRPGWLCDASPVFQQAAVTTDPLDTRGGFHRSRYIGRKRRANVSRAGRAVEPVQGRRLGDSPSFRSSPEACLGMVQLAARADFPDPTKPRSPGRGEV